MRHTEVIAELLSQRHYAWHVLETYKRHPTATPGIIDRWDRKFRALDYAVVILSGARAAALEHPLPGPLLLMDRPKQVMAFSGEAPSLPTVRQPSLTA